LTGFLGGIWSRARDRRGVSGWLLFLLLFPLSFVYRAGLAISRVRRRGLPVWDRAVPVLGIGNLTVGGTGKTPLVLLLAGRLEGAGRRPAVLSRGYRGKRAKDPCVVRAFGGNILLGPREAGDEPRLIAEKAGKGVSVVVARDRVKGCAMAVDELGADLLILDDGFQQRMRFPRGFHIVTVNAARPLEGNFLLPAGDLREPVRALDEAAAVVLTHAEEVEPERISFLKRLMKGITPGAAVAVASHQVESLVDHGSGERFELSRIKGGRVLVFSALGYPEGFEKLVAGTVLAKVVGFRAPDHHRWNAADFSRIRHLLSSQECHALVTTEKDAARMGEFPGFGVPLLIAKLKFTFVDGESELEAALKAYLEGF